MPDVAMSEYTFYIKKGAVMNIYFDREGLVDSREFYEEKELPYTLFASISSVYPFVKFEEELVEINDYCLFLLRCLEEKLKILIEDSKAPFHLVEGYRRAEERAGETMDELFDTAHMFSPVKTWEKLSHDINKCTLLLLILSYLESSLNEIAKWFCEERLVPLGRKERGDDEITFYIRKIGQCCACDLAGTLKKELAYVREVRKIRNQFVHREWNQVGRHYDKFRLCDVFCAVSVIFAETEKAACDAGIIERSELFGK